MGMGMGALSAYPHPYPGVPLPTTRTGLWYPCYYLLSSGTPQNAMKSDRSSDYICLDHQDCAKGLRSGLRMLHQEFNLCLAIFDTWMETMEERFLELETEWKQQGRKLKQLTAQMDLEALEKATKTIQTSFNDLQESLQQKTQMELRTFKQMQHRILTESRVLHQFQAGLKSQLHKYEKAWSQVRGTQDTQAGNLMALSGGIHLLRKELELLRTQNGYHEASLDECRSQSNTLSSKLAMIRETLASGDAHMHSSERSLFSMLSQSNDDKGDINHNDAQSLLDTEPRNDLVLSTPKSQSEPVGAAKANILNPIHCSLCPIVAFATPALAEDTRKRQDRVKFNDQPLQATIIV
ncbi:hypothetical protein BJ138DRAFT_1120084 [Hygrophoropsis aurantiaca]|uniref:Uncharacterized protein n=1 Tax=Hygrophoropsis aurantiaca TaxID=72124 RepID=A0ACB7ZRP0_9AGAM|nr:hypothetical protein BJ138DRAFT_1120084 [Hygrophoropsis aurantiaca]